MDLQESQLQNCLTQTFTTSYSRHSAHKQSGALAVGIWCLEKEGRLTSPVRLGLLLTEEATELMELREEAEGLRFRLAGVVAITRLTAAALALAGVVEGKPIFVTLWTGANNPYLG